MRQGIRNVRAAGSQGTSKPSSLIWDIKGISDGRRQIDRAVEGEPDIEATL